MKIAMANPQPCSECPWRIQNQEKEHPHGFYDAKNLKRLWKAISDGYRMSCHPTDPRMAEFAGYESCEQRETTHECAGALVLQQREVMLFQEIAKTETKALAAYKKQRPNGMTQHGLLSVVERAVFPGWPGEVEMRRDLDLGNKELGYDKNETAHSRAR